MNYTQATALIRSHTDYGGSVDVHALAVAISSAPAVDDPARGELRNALQLCYEHCRLYHPEIEHNNVGEAVRAALSANTEAESGEPVAWFDKELNTLRWKDGLVNADFRDGQAFYTAPPAASTEREALTKADMIELYYIAREKPKSEWMYILRAALAANLKTDAVESNARPAASGQKLTDEQIARAWFGAEYGPGHTRAPGYVYSFLDSLRNSSATASDKEGA